MGSGLRLGSYRLLEPLGSGGMGEVWLAEDVRLGRRVAIKVLPPGLAAEPGRREAFVREARAVAALDHAHIIAVHDVGEATTAEGTLHYIVMEAVSGRSLREILAEGPLARDTAIRLVTELAEALTAAHGAGVLHLDVKPENVIVTDGGHAKLLDFGLARLEEARASSIAVDSSLSPTRIDPLLRGGTAGYMAPEQIEGRRLDARTDLFALGCVLFEAVSGRQAFAGRDVVEVLHQTLHGETPRLPAGSETSPRLEWILEKCLAGAPEDRYQGAADLLVDLRRLARQPARTAGPGEPAAPGRRPWPWLAAIAATLLLAAAATGALAPERAAPPLPSHLEVGLPDAHAFAGTGRVVALAPDGRTVAVAASDASGERHLHVRSVADIHFRVVPGSEGALRPFFSPDGRWIGFSTFGTLKKVAVAGGDPFVVARVQGSPDAAWLDDDRIVFEQPDGLWVVSAGGGDATLVATPRTDRGEEELERPAPLPGGRHVLVEVGTTEGRDGVGLVELASGRVTVLVREGSSPRYDRASGNIVYSRQGTLFAAPVDLRALRVAGTPRPVLDGVQTEGRGAAQFDVAWNGRLLYVPGSGGAGSDALAWIDEDGGVARLDGSEREGEIYGPRLSPDGGRVALMLREAGTSDVWLYDLAARGYRRVTTGGTGDNPVWSPDGEWLYYTEERGGDLDVYRRDASLAGTAERVLGGPGNQVITWMGADGRRVLYTDESGGSAEIRERQLADGSGSSSSPLAAGSGGVDMATVSPDGRWIAYRSTESGRREVWVRPADAEAARIQVSRDGGSQPAWSPDGRLLLRAGNGALVEATVGDRGLWRMRLRLAAGVPANRWVASYDVAADGRVLMPWRSLRSGIERIAAGRMILAEGWLR